MLTSREKHIRRAQRQRAKLRVRVQGSRLRLSVARSNKNISVQLIDDSKGATLASASTMEADIRKGLKSTGNIEAAKKVGTVIAGRVREAGVTAVVFDRGGFMFHGRIKALADAARAGGLEF